MTDIVNASHIGLSTKGINGVLLTSKLQGRDFWVVGVCGQDDSFIHAICMQLVPSVDNG